MKYEIKREKVGKISTDLINKDTSIIDVRDQGEAMTSEYMKELFKTIEDGKKIYSNDFFVVVITKREKLLTNVMRNYFLHRSTCPTPDYDQAVYHYIKSNDETELLWVIPSKQFSIYIVDNALTLDSEYKELIGFVLDFKNNILFDKAKKFNNEDLLDGKVVLKIID